MLFNNLSLDVFGCEVKPNEAVSDEYTFCSGGTSKPDAEITDAATEDKAVADGNEGSPGTDPDPGFAGPTPDTPDVSNKPQVGDLATGEDLREINEERAIGGQPPIPDPNTTTPPQQAQQPPVPSSDRTTRTQQQISGRFDLQTGTATINDRVVSLDEYNRFQNMTREEKFNNYGQDILRDADAELERARRGDRSGLDDALDF